MPAQNTVVTDFFSGLDKPAITPTGGTPSDAASKFFSSLPAPQPVQEKPKAVAPPPQKTAFQELTSLVSKAPIQAFQTIQGFDVKKIGQSIAAGAKALPSMVKQAGGIILGGWVQQQKAIDTFFSPLPQKIKEAIKLVVPGTTPTSIVEKAAPKAIELREQGVQEQKKATEAYTKSFTPSKGLQGYLEMAAYNLPQMAASTGLSVATAIITKNPLLAASVGLSTSYGLGASEVYNEARSQGQSDSQALPLSMIGGVLIGALDFLPLGRLLKKTEAVNMIKKSIVKNIAQGIVSIGVQAGFEGITEGAQEVVGNALARTYNENQDLLKGVKESVFVGAILGGLGDVTVSGTVSLLNKKVGPEEVVSAIEQKIEKAIETPANKRTPAQQQIATTILSKEMTPDEATSFVVENDMGKSSEGKKVMLAVLQAKKENKSILISPTSDEKNIEIKLVKPGQVTKRAEAAVTEQKPIKGGKYILVPEGKTERHILSTKETRVIQETIRIRMDEIRQNATSPELLHQGINDLYNDISARAQNDKVVLSSLRTAINKEMFSLAGAEGATYKQQYASLKMMMDDPEIGPTLHAMEGFIADIDKKLTTAQEPVIVKRKQPKEKTIEQKGRPIEKVGEEPKGESKTVKPSRLFERVKETLGKEYEDTSISYNTLDLEKQAQRVVRLIESDPDMAARIAYGLEETPSGMTRNALSVGLAEFARTQGDYALAAKLWTKTSLRSTRLGQEIVSLRGNMDSTNPLNYVRQVVNQRLASVAKNWKGLLEKFDVAEYATLQQKAMAVIQEKTQELRVELQRRAKDFQTAQSIIDALRC